MLILRVETNASHDDGELVPERRRNARWPGIPTVLWNCPRLKVDDPLVFI